MKRISVIASLALVLVVAGGVWDCLMRAPECHKDPCWLHCAMEGISSPTVAALLAVLISVVGFETWKAQLAGAARHDAARKVISAMKTLGEVIAAARHDLVLVKEVRRGANFLGGAPAHLQGKNPQHVAQLYGEPVWKATDQLRAAEADAVAAIGWEANEALAPVFRTVRMFQHQFAVQWDGNISPEEGEKRRQGAAKWGMKPDALYHSGKDDDYAKQLADVFAAAEDYFRRFVDPKVRKGRR